MEPVGVAMRRGKGALPRGYKRSGVSAWCLAKVNPFRWNEFGVDVAYSDFPAGIVDHTMVFAAEHHQIIDIGSAAVQPMNNMM